MHVIGPQLGLTQPGMTIVCGDSHTSTHGAFGAIAFGIGTSEVEHVLATQTLTQARPKTMAVTVNGSLPDGVTAKDLVLTLIAHTGTGGGQGYIVEYRGPAIEELSMEARMTICNMSIEWGAKAGLIAPDQTTFDYLEGRPEAPKGDDWDAAVEHWNDPGHRRRRDLRRGDRARRLDDDAVRHLGHQPRPGRAARRQRCPSPDDFEDEGDQIAAEKALEYMGLEAGTPMREVKVDTVFVGSCTNGRIEDLRAAAEVIKGRTVAADTRLLVVPGSVRVRLQAEDEGLDVVFKEAGGEWRGAGCSMCLGMNPDQLEPGERSASTSNRNFEGRQGKGGRTHLVSPLVAAATAVTGTLASPADLPPARPERRTDDGEVHPAHRHRRCRCGAATSTPTRSSRRSTSSGSPAPASRTGCSRPGARTRSSCSTGRSTTARRARRRPRLRHRLVARARRVGVAWTTASRS